MRSLRRRATRPGNTSRRAPIQGLCRASERVVHAGVLATETLPRSAILTGRGFTSIADKPERPSDRLKVHPADDRVVPRFDVVAERGIEHPTFSVLFGPRDCEISIRPVHQRGLEIEFRGVKMRQHMDAAP